MSNGLALDGLLLLGALLQSLRNIIQAYIYKFSVSEAEVDMGYERRRWKKKVGNRRIIFALIPATEVMHSIINYI